jgi:hypothetical protein
MKEIIIDGVRYVPEEKKSSTQGYTDRELINRALFDEDERRDPAEEQRKYDEAHRVW